MKNKRKILLETENIITKYKNDNSEEYKDIKETYERYQNDLYHDSITDRMYLNKMKNLISEFHERNTNFLVIVFILIFSFITIVTGYFINDYFYRLSKIDNGIIELTDTYNKIFFGNKDEFLLIKFSDMDDMVLTREKSEIKVSLNSTSSNIVDYSIFVVTDNVTKLNYSVVLDNITYGTNVLNSKNNRIYTGTINPNSRKDVTIELWQNEYYNLNAQLRLYVKANIIK